MDVLQTIYSLWTGNKCIAIQKRIMEVSQDERRYYLFAL